MKNFTKKLCFTALLLSSLTAYCQIPHLNSLTVPASQPTIFLDFDGQTVMSGAWQSGDPFICAPSGLTPTQITEIFNRVSEDYRPFTVNITTDSTKFFLAPAAQRIRLVVTSTSAWYPGVGGITYTNSFTWGDDSPGFVFVDRLANNPKYIAECCSHEAGHALGLSHQSKYDANCTLVESYSTGAGTGETGWAPVMGKSYGKNMTGWNVGPTPYDCAIMQDNLTIITTSPNGVGYRGDDFSETLDNNTNNLNPLTFNVPGIISTPTDKDAFKLTLSTGGSVHIEATPYNLGAGNEGANLDIMLLLYNSAKTLVRTYDPLTSMSVSIDTALNPGTYYIKIAGAGNNNTSNYGSLGSYTLSGFKGALPIHNVSLQGTVNKNIHRLSWDVIADEQIATQVLEVSTNGTDFKPIMTTNGAPKNYNYVPEKAGIMYYRLKVTSVIDQSMYSNIIALKATGSDEKSFIVSTLAQQNITVTASDNYTFNLYDINARLITSGKDRKGTNSINVQNLPKGMYVLQLMSDNYKQTERIIKQ